MFRPFPFIAFATYLLTASAADAAIYRVGSDAACTHPTIQAAIDSAAAASGADEIRVVLGTWTGTALRIDGDSDELRIVGGYAACADDTPQPESSTLEGTVGAPILTIVDSRNVTLVGLDLRDAITAYSGAGIYFAATQGELTLVDSFVSSNQAHTGGGISIGNREAGVAPDAVRLVLRGRSGIVGNVATHGDGGGIACSAATIRLLDETFAASNQTTLGNGGGISAHGCRVEIGTRGFINGALWSNQAPAGRGGALYVAGPGASAAIYPVDPWVPARVHLNRARFGGGIAASGGARVDVFQGQLAQNRADLEGGAVWLADGGEGFDTRFTMHRSPNGAPAGAVACALGEDCNRMQANLALDEIGNPGSGAALFVRASVPGSPSGSAHARLEGTRIDDSSGDSLIAQTSTDGHIELDGALIVDNALESFVAVSIAPTSSIDFIATTIAGNTLGSGGTVLFAPIACSVDSEARGTRIDRSIIWQPGHPLLTTFGGAPQANCYRHLVGNLFNGLPDSPERVVADPEFQWPQQGDYTLSPYSPAMDFAPAHPGDATRDGGPRVFDVGSFGNRFGPQDLGAYEVAPDDLIFAHGFD